MDEDDSIWGKDKTSLGKGADASPQPKQQPYAWCRHILKTNTTMGALRLTAQMLCHPGKCSVNISTGD